MDDDDECPSSDEAEGEGRATLRVLRLYAISVVSEKEKRRGEERFSSEVKEKKRLLGF
ncbi:hypothetical protein LguiB_020472 [Lonicera macranthoides]